MTLIEPKIFEEIKSTLANFDNRYFTNGELNRTRVSEDLRKYDERLISNLLNIEYIQKHYIKEIAGKEIFLIDQLEDTILYSNYWDTSYTKYENRIGLISNDKFVSDNEDIVLSFPFKDCVLTAAMSKEDKEEGYDDSFFNEIIEKNEIDRLFDKKILTNIIRYDDNGNKKMIANLI